MITDEHLVLERNHPGMMGGVQRIYRFEGGRGLSLVNSQFLRSFPFAWEAAVLRGVSEDGTRHELLDYDTELTDDVEVFDTDEEANEFIARAAALFSSSDIN